MISPGPYSSISAGSLPMHRRPRGRGRRRGTARRARRRRSGTPRSSAGGALVRASWASVMPTELPRRGGLDHEPRVAACRPRTPRARRARRRGRAPSAPRGPRTQSVTGSPSPRDEPLEHRLVHADGARRHARARVREARRLAQRLGRPVLAERAVEREEHDGPRRRAPAIASRASAGRRRAVGAQRGRVVVGGLRPAVAAEPVGQPPPAAVEVDQPASRPGSRTPASASAIADPDTIDTSCSADGPPSTTATGRRRRGRGASGGTAIRRPPPGPAGPVAGELDLERELDAATARGPRARTCSATRRTSAAVPLRSLTMKLACFSDTAAPPER